MEYLHPTGIHFCNENIFETFINRIEKDDKIFGRIIVQLHYYYLFATELFNMVN